jgi:ribonuclease D
MDKNHLEHAIDIAETAKNLIIRKYTRGQKEHGGSLWRKKGLVDMAIEEAIDQVIYLLTLRNQLEEMGIEPGEIDE